MVDRIFEVEAGLEEVSTGSVKNRKMIDPQTPKMLITTKNWTMESLTIKKPPRKKASSWANAN